MSIQGDTLLVKFDSYIHTKGSVSCILIQYANKTYKIPILKDGDRNQVRIPLVNACREIWVSVYRKKFTAEAIMGRGTVLLGKVIKEGRDDTFCPLEFHTAHGEVQPAGEVRLIMEYEKRNYSTSSTYRPPSGRTPIHHASFNDSNFYGYREDEESQNYPAWNPHPAVYHNPQPYDRSPYTYSHYPQDPPRLSESCTHGCTFRHHHQYNY